MNDKAALRAPKTKNYSKLRIIFHHPRPIIESGVSGSQVRPYKMLRAFKALGVDVVEVTGDTKTRAIIMQNTKDRIRHGERFDFVYSENLTIPFAMSEPHRLPIHPLCDHRFLAFCHKTGIPVSMFYRDAYWRDESYKAMLPWFGRIVTVPLYWYDWWWHLRYIHTMYMPSLAMAKALPGIDKFNFVKELPPGAEISNRKNIRKDSSTLKLFYVGGIEPPTYDLRPLLASVQHAGSQISLTLCCRKKEWEKLSHIYQTYITDQVNVVHRSSNELAALYNDSDLFVIIRNRNNYLDFSVPTKVYESIGFGLPILCSSGDETARRVTSENLGWVRNVDVIADFLRELVTNPELIDEKKKQVMELRYKHTWASRAAQVCDHMTNRANSMESNH